MKADVLDDVCCSTGVEQPYRFKIQHMVPTGALGVEDGIPPTEHDLRAIFDTQCDSCDTNTSWVDGLCKICVHSRIRHLIFCLQDDDLEMRPLINLGRVFELANRKSCNFCSLIAHNFATTRIDRPRDVHPEDPVLMFPRIEALSTMYRRTILLSHLGTPDLLFFTPADHTLDGFWSIGTERYMKVVQSTESPRQEYSTRMLNWTKVSEWVEECHQEDATKTARSLSKTARLPRHFKVLDLELGCLVDAPTSTRFAALSYMWGKKLDDEIETTKENIEMLSTAGCLDEIELPQTIRDAIVFCRKIHITKLWIDRLCIVQDDAAQKHDQISAMDAIYAGATFTICATAGDSSRHGLPGVGNTGRPYARSEVQLADVRLLPVQPGARQCLADGSWFERGWTFQESLLGGKLFLFTEWQLFFRNKDYEFEYEDEMTEVDDGWSKDSVVVNPPGKESAEVASAFAHYAQHVATYSGRKLSYESDTYNAFAGVFRSLYGDLSGYFYGLPEKDFDLAIMWGARPVSNLDCPREVTGVILPSWSWGSLMHWTPEILFGQNDIVASVAQWARCDVQGNMRTIMANNDPTAHQTSCRWDTKGTSPTGAIDPRLHVLAAWDCCFESPAPVLRELRSLTGRLLFNRWPTYSHFWKEAFKQQITMSDDNDIGTLFAGTGRVLVRTTIARYRLWAGNTVGASQDFYILDQEGWCVGTCRIPIAIATAKKLLPASNPDLGIFEFLALSLRFSRGSDFFDNLRRKVCRSTTDLSSNREISFQAPPLSAHPSPLSELIGHDGITLDPPLVLSVMLIAWKGNVAHRIWVGQVSLALWMKDRPAHRTIVLE